MDVLHFVPIVPASWPREDGARSVDPSLEDCDVFDMGRVKQATKNKTVAHTYLHYVLLYILDHETFVSTGETCNRGCQNMFSFFCNRDCTVYRLSNKAKKVRASPLLTKQSVHTCHGIWTKSRKRTLCSDYNDEEMCVDSRHGVLELRAMVVPYIFRTVQFSHTGSLS